MVSKQEWMDRKQNIKMDLEGRQSLCSMFLNHIGLYKLLPALEIFPSMEWRKPALTSKPCFKDSLAK